MSEQKSKGLTERQIKLLSASAVVLFLVLLIVLIANIVAVGVLKSRENRLRAEFERLSGENAQIQTELNKRNTDIYTEQYARDYLGMVREGEVVVITTSA